MLDSYPLELDDFRSWLQAQPERKRIAMTCHTGKCPIAQYLASTYGMDAEVVSDTYALTTGELLNDEEGEDIDAFLDRTYWSDSLPYWAAVFVQEVDERYPQVEPHRPRTHIPNITAKQALKILNKAAA